MKVLLKVVGVAALVASTAFPALAQMDAGAMTCGDFYGMDDAGRADALNAITNFINDTANSAVAAVAQTAITGMDSAGVQQLIDVGCEGQAVDTNLISTIK
jgi:hypothetical protein